MLRTLSTKSARPRKGIFGVGGDSRARHDRIKIDDEVDDEVDDKVDDEFDDKVDDEVDDKVGKKSRNPFKSKNPSKSKNLSKSKKIESGFFTFGARMAFTKLRQAFIKAQIVYHFDLECHIWVEMDVSGYVINGVLSQLILDNLGQWHPVAFFLRKMILAKTRYKTQDSKVLTIFETFKTWKHYLEGSQHEMLIFTDYNNLRRFMQTKSLSSRQVRWAQKLSCYHFQIDYCQGKANKAANVLSQYL